MYNLLSGLGKWQVLPEYCRPVDGYVKTANDDNILLIPSEDAGSLRIRPVSKSSPYTKRLSISSKCRIRLESFYVDVQGTCLVEKTISVEYGNTVAGIGAEYEQIFRDPRSANTKLIGVNFTDEQHQLWLSWQDSHQDADYYHIDIGIREASEDTSCLVRKVGHNKAEQSIAVLVQGIFVAYNSVVIALFYTARTHARTHIHTETEVLERLVFMCDVDQFCLLDGTLGTQIVEVCCINWYCLL